MAKNFWVDPNLLGFEPGTWSSGGIRPHVDILEEADEILISVELPGVKEEDIQLCMNEGVLFIVGEKHPQTKEWEHNYYLAEREFGAFRRSINLPPGLDEEAADADFEEGVLTIRVPRLAEKAPSERGAPVESR